MQSRMDLLGTPLFIFSIALLALNDFVLKAALHNWITGKLSDFAGLIAFTLFTCAIWPRYRWGITGVVCLSFLYWKSPYSQPLIDFSNIILPFPIGRTVDYSDLIALPGVVLVPFFLFRLRPWPIKKWAILALAITSLLLFSATSCIQQQRIVQTASFSDNSVLSNSQHVEQELLLFFDGIAIQHDLRCFICDPLSSGRLYVKDKNSPREFSMTVHFDRVKAVLYYNVACWTQAGGNKTQEIDKFNADIEQELKVRFPTVNILKGEIPQGRTIRLTVTYDDMSLFSFLATRTRKEDYLKTVAIVRTIVEKYGLQASYSGRKIVVYDAGKLFAHELREINVSVQYEDKHKPKIVIVFSSLSEHYSDLQSKLAAEIEKELQSAFGKDRISTH